MTFKASDIAFRVLPERPGGAADGLDEAELRDHIDASYSLVVQGLSRKRRQALRLPDRT